MTIMRIQERPRPRAGRLGRHVEHDPRSWTYPAPMCSRIVSVMHRRLAPVFDQGAVGSCTGNAAVGCISSEPFGHSGTEDEALDVYEEATRIDSIPGEYPPDDTGSSGLAVMKVLKTRGLIAGYAHAFGLGAVLRALALRPGITGIAWREGCDMPDAQGVVRYEGEIVGGHEVVLTGIDVAARLVWMTNSWGPAWGVGGMFAMSWADYQSALGDHGDATFPIAT